MRRFIVASGDAAPILEAAEGSLDHITEAIGLSVEGVFALACGIVRYDRRGAAIKQPLSQGIGVVGRIGQA